MCKNDVTNDCAISFEFGELICKFCITYSCNLDLRFKFKESFIYNTIGIINVNIMQFNLYTSIYFIWSCMLQWRLFVMTSCSSTTSCDVMLSDDLMCLEDTRDNVRSVEWSLAFQNNFIEVACAETIWVVSLISVCLHYNRLFLITGFCR